MTKILYFSGYISVCEYANVDTMNLAIKNFTTCNTHKNENRTKNSFTKNFGYMLKGGKNPLRILFDTERTARN